MDSPPVFYSISPRKNKSESNSKLSKIPLKSSIPVPAPAQRRDPRARSASSCYSQQFYSNSNTPRSSFEREKTSLSLSSRQASSKKPARPMTAGGARNQYGNVKAKTDSNQKNQCQYSKLGHKSSSESVDNMRKSSTESHNHEKKQNRDEIIEKQKQLLTIYNELKKLQPLEDLQPIELEICSLMEKKTLGHLEGLTRVNPFLKECTPEFLSTFEGQMRDVTEGWYKLMFDIITTKSTLGKSSLARLSMPDPSLDLRNEIAKFLTNVSQEGEPLNEKLRWIEDELVKSMSLVMHNVVALSKEHRDLKDENIRLKKTQDQINSQQNEQMEILAQENKELDRKYALAVDKYNIEKNKVEHHEKNLQTIQKEMMETKKILKYSESRCNDIEMRTKKAEAAKRNLEITLRNMELALEKEGKQHRELFEKYSHSGEVINRLKYQLEENKCLTTNLEETNRDLQVELKNLKASLEENHQKRNELVEELNNKSKKLNELKEQMDTLKKNYEEGNCLGLDKDYTNNLIVKDLTKNVQEKNHHLNELKKKTHELENNLKEMESRERMLMKQVKELMKNRSDNDIVLKSQVQELQYRVKDLEREKAELEKILAQKTLELDQRDLMMREHAKLLQARDELIPMIKDRQANERQCTEKLMAVVFDHYKNYCPDAMGKAGDQNPYKSIEALEKHFGLDPRMVDKELSFRQEKMTEMFNLLEYKQMEINKLERRIREIQGAHHPSLDMFQKEKRNRGKSKTRHTYEETD